MNTGWGFGCIAIGLFTAAMVYFKPENLNVPDWVAYAACSTFVFAGFAMLFDAAKYPRLRAWFAVGILAMLLTVGSWVSVGPGERVCSVSDSVFKTVAPDILCRGAFGVGAIICAAMLAWAIKSALRGTT